MDIQTVCVGAEVIPVCGPRDGNGHSTVQGIFAPLCGGQMKEDVLQRGNLGMTSPPWEYLFCQM